MNSRTRAFVLAAIVASIAVLAVLPAEDASADPSADVSYKGYYENGSVLTITFDQAQVHGTIVLTGDDQQTYTTEFGSSTSGKVTHNVLLTERLAAGTYAYSVTIYGSSSVYATGTLVVDHEYEYGTETNYTITWMNGTETLATDTVAQGATPAYSGAAPVKAADAQYTYAFAGWSATVDGDALEAIPAATADATYYAVFTQTVNQYTVTFYDEDGTTVLDQQELDYGAAITYKGQTPSKAADAQYTYAFAGWDPALAADATVAGDASYKATYTATEIPVDVDCKVSYSEDIESVTLEDGTAVEDGSTVKSGTTLVVKAKPVEGKTATVSPALADGKYTVTADVTFSVTYTDEPIETTGIAIGDEPFDTLDEAVAAAESGDVITISKAVSGDVTLPEGVSISVTGTGSYIGAVVYKDSTVVVKSLGQKSEVTVKGGSVDIAGTFRGASEFEVTAGTAVLSGKIETNASVTVTVDAGAVLQIGELTADYTTSTVKVVGDGKIEFAPNTIYQGPAIINDSGVIGIKEEDGSRNGSIAYNEGSRIYFQEDGQDVYENIYHIARGAIDITVGVADIVVPYTGKEIQDSDVRTQTVRVDSYTDPYEPTSAAVPSIVENYGDTHEGAVIQNPDSYDKAVEVFVVGGQGAQGLSRVLYADLTVSKIDISEANRDITVESDSPKTYTGETVVFTYTFKGLTQGLDLPVDQYTVTYTDAQGNEVEAEKLIEAGTYTAKIDASAADYYYGTRALEVVIEKAPTTLSLTDNTDGAGWTSEAYADEDVSYTVDPSAYTKDSGAVLNVTLTATLAGATSALQPVTGTIASQDELDALIKGAFVGEDYDAGYTLVITLSNVESKNYLKATDATLTIQVGEHVKAPIYISFSDVDDSKVVTSQDDEKDTTVSVASKGTGLSKENGVYTFVIKAASATSGVVLNSTEGAVGYTVLGPSGQTNAVYDAAAGTITFTFEELPTSIDFTLQASANSTRYYDSPVYTIDLSNVVSDDIAIYLVQSGYPIARYTSNQLYDLSGDGTSVTGDVAKNEKLYLPQTSAAGGHWVLQTPEGSTAATYYAGGALYLIDAADRVSYTLSETMKLNGKDVTSLYGIVFVSEGGSSADPSAEKQTVAIEAVGYTVGNGDDVINAALTAAGRTDNPVGDCYDASVFYVVFTTSFDGAVTVTLNGEALETPASFSSWTAGVHVVYWPADYTVGSTYKVTIAQATDSSVSDSVSYVFSGDVAPAPSTETSTDLAVSVRLSGERISFVVSAYDGKAVPTGTVTITYYVLEDAFGIGQYVPVAHPIEASVIEYSAGQYTAYGYADVPAGTEVYSYYGTFSSDAISQPVNSQVIYREA